MSFANLRVKKSEFSDCRYSIRVPLIEILRKVDRIIMRTARYLSIIGKGLYLTAAEVTDDGECFTEFYFDFFEPQPNAEKAVEFALNQALRKEG